MVRSGAGYNHSTELGMGIMFGVGLNVIVRNWAGCNHSMESERL